MRALIPAGMTILFTLPAFAQKIKSDEFSYFYTRLPLQPLDKAIKNYTAKIDAVYEEKNKQLMAEYELAKQKAEDKYKQDLAEYPAAVKAAEKKYEEELAEYKKKSMGEKVAEKTLLGQDNKPVKQIPSKPYPENILKPILKTSYDYPVLTNTYFHLDGYENNPSNAVQVIITMYGFDYTEPRVLSAQKNMVSYKNGSSSTYTSTWYHAEFSYRHPMSVKVLLPDGKEAMNVTPQSLNTYKIYRSSETETMPQINNESMIKTYEEKLLQENLKFINGLVNDKYGFGKAEKKAVIYYIKEKGDEYADLSTALNAASSGFNLFGKDPETAKSKLQQAIDTWNTALKESDPTNKKARIDKDVTIAVYFNLLEAYFALGDDKQGGDVLQKLNALSLSGSDRKIKDEFETIFADLKKRKQINQ
jgi:hypothetical protein